MHVWTAGDGAAMVTKPRYRIGAVLIDPVDQDRVPPGYALFPMGVRYDFKRVWHVERANGIIDRAEW